MKETILKGITILTVLFSLNTYSQGFKPCSESDFALIQQTSKTASTPVKVLMSHIVYDDLYYSCQVSKSSSMCLMACGSRCSSESTFKFENNYENSPVFVEVREDTVKCYDDQSSAEITSINIVQ
tara:strand:+ start:330 stop:704 length:375 start_codon:yes stop_codon:yes gene_type:complete